MKKTIKKNMKELETFFALNLPNMNNGWFSSASSITINTSLIQSLSGATGPKPKHYISLKEDFITIAGKRCYRIKAIADFKDVKVGDLGGYIDNESHLEDNSWVYSGKVLNSRLYGGTEIHDNSIIVDNNIISSILRNVVCDGVTLSECVVLSDTRIQIIPHTGADSSDGTPLELYDTLMVDTEDNFLDAMFKYDKRKYIYQNVSMVLLSLIEGGTSFLDKDGNIIPPIKEDV